MGERRREKPDGRGSDDEGQSDQRAFAPHQSPARARIARLAKARNERELHRGLHEAKGRADKCREHAVGGKFEQTRGGSHHEPLELDEDRSTRLDRGQRQRFPAQVPR